MGQRSGRGFAAFIALAVAGVFFWMLADARELTRESVRELQSAERVREDSPRALPAPLVEARPDQPTPLKAELPPLDPAAEPAPSPATHFGAQIVIVDSEGLPVPQARVLIANGYRIPDDADWDALGPDASWSAQVSKQDARAGASLHARAPGFHDGQLHLPGVVEGGVDLGELVLQPAPRVEGVVLDASGRPVIGAQVWGMSRKGSTTGPLVTDPTQTDPGGGFVLDLDRIRSDRTQTVVAWHESVGGPAWQELRFDHDGVAREVELRLGMDTTLAGRVVDELGEPIRGASVALAVMAKHTVRSVEVDAAGRFRLPTQLAPELWVGAAASGYRGVQGLVAELEAPLDELVFTLTASCELEFRVTDAVSGEPIPEFEGHLGERMASGSIVMRHLEGKAGLARAVGLSCDSEIMKLEFTAPGYVRLKHSAVERELMALGYLQPGAPVFAERVGELSSPIDIALTRPAQLGPFDLRGVDERGAPVAGAVLSAFSDSKSQVAAPPSDEQGWWRGLMLPEGEHAISALTDDGRFAAPLEVAITEATQSLPDLVLRPAVSFHGRLVTDDGTPLPELLVRLSPSGSKRSTRDGRSTVVLKTAPDGSFGTDELAHGRWLASLWRGGIAATEGWGLGGAGFDFAPGESREVVLPITVSRSLRVRLSPSRADGGEGWSFTLQQLPDPLASADWSPGQMSDPTPPGFHDGVAVKERVGLGLYRLKVIDAEGELRAEEQVRLEPSLTAEHFVDVRWQ